MSCRSIVSFCLLAGALPPVVFAQGPAIEHDPVHCVVAGKFPKLNACIAPVGDVARARVYFKAAQSPHWYWVEFKSDTPCFTAILPKPTKKIAEMNYYVEAASRKAQSSRTEDRTVKIVADAGECEKDKPAAPWVPNASVTVGAAPGAPAAPFGFAAAGSGIGAGTLVVAAGGLGAATTGLVAAKGDGDAGTAVTVAPPIVVSQPPATPTSPPAPTATPATADVPRPLFRPVLTVQPTSGVEPVRVTFNACRSEGHDLKFSFDFDGDGSEDLPRSCNRSVTYTLAGLETAARPAKSRAGRDFSARVVIREGDGGNTYEETVVIHVDPVPEVETPTPTPTPAATSTPTPTPTPCDAVAPMVALAMPTPGWEADTGGTLGLSATATDAGGMDRVEFFAQEVDGGGDRRRLMPAPVMIGTASGKGPTYAMTWTSIPEGGCGVPWIVYAVAHDACGNSTTSEEVPGEVEGSCDRPSTTRGLAWSSQLTVEGAEASLVINEGGARPIGFGHSFGQAPTRPTGPNRIELVVRQGAGRAGVWRFRFVGTSGWDPSTLNVLAGDVVSLTGDEIVFRLGGRPGERVVFEVGR
jgi:hypothetical protein